MATSITVAGPNPATGVDGTATITLDDTSAGKIAVLILQYVGWTPTIDDPANPGNQIANPVTPGAAILGLMFGHLKGIAAQQERINAIAASTAASSIAAIPPPTLS